MKIAIQIALLLFTNVYCICGQSAKIENILNNLEFRTVDVGYDEGLSDVQDIYFIEQDSKGIIWIGSVFGLFRYNGSSVLDITRGINEKQGKIIDSRRINALKVDDSDNIWFGTTDGLYILKQDSMVCKEIELSSSKELTAFHRYINQIKFIGNSAFIGTHDGVFELNKISLIPLRSYLQKGLPVNEKGTSSNTTEIFSGLTQDDIYFSTRSGIIKLDSAYNIKDTFAYNIPKQLYHYAFASRKINNKIVFPDYKYGMIVFDLETETFFPNNSNFEADHWWRLKSQVYIGDNLFLINAENKGLGIYNLADYSYQWLESSGRTKYGMYNLNMDRYGFVWYSTFGKMYKSNLSFLNESATPKFIIDNSHITVNGQKFWTILNKSDKILLQEDQNNLEISFSIVPSLENNDLKYFYRLDNTEEKKIAHKNLLQLFNLSSGKHDIKIMAKKNKVEIASTKIDIEIDQPFYKTTLFLAGIIAFFSFLIFGIYWYKKRQYEYKLKVKSEYEKKVAQLENQALRSQINPHFIFNTLNSIKYYSIQKTSEETSDFISSFSILIRRILENSKKNLITLDEEIETLKNYTEIEDKRFHKGFERVFHIDENINTSQFLVPPMIIQPFVENAIWHGLMHKSDNRKLIINFISQEAGIICQVIDNGVGRVASERSKNRTSHKTSLGMKITQERMRLINDRNKMDNTIEIIDLYDDDNNPLGTQVNVSFKFVLGN